MAGNLNPNVASGGPDAVNISDLLDYGKTFLGTKYVWGGSQPGGFDCSGLVQYTFGNMGVRLPRTAAQQARTGYAVSQQDAQPGDLVYWGNPAHHIGIYLGNGMMLAAPHTGDVVQIQKVYGGVSGYRRVVTDNGQPSTGLYGAANALSGTGAKPVDPAATLAQYGQVQMLADSNPEIKALLARGVQEQWTADRFKSEFENSAYYRNTSDSRRKMNLLRTAEPGEYQRQRDSMINNIWALGTSLGAKLDDQAVGEIAEMALNFGWSNDELRRNLANHVSATHPTGGAATTVQSMKEQAAQYLVPLTDATLQQWTQQVAAGVIPMDSFKSYLIEQAKTLFPSLSSALDAGTTVAQYLQPYQSMASQTLEVPSAGIDWNDPKYRSALFGKDDQGKQKVASLTDYQQYLKMLPDYRKTRQANEGAAGIVNGILQTFGKVAA